MRALVLCALLAATARADAPPRHPWSHFKVGSWVRIKSGNASTSLVTKSTLAALENGYTLSVETTGGYGSPAPRPERHALGELMPSADPAGRRGATESLSAAGKVWLCVTWDWAGPTSTGRSTVREWRAPNFELPIRVVAMDQLPGGLSTRVTLTLAGLDEKLAVGGRTVHAARYEGQVATGSTVIPLERWISLEVPGGMVKEVRMKDGKPFSSSVVEAFGAVR